MRAEWTVALQRWAANNDNVSELWLFGSRTKGTASATSDIDIALRLMPADGKHDWALGILTRPGRFDRTMTRRA
ncbi:nucleotidyltransferase family protein [Bradyrhizobium sp. USDA 3364]